MSDAELDELYKTAKRREIQEVVDDLLDKENSQKFRFSKYLKEGIEIYLREISNINESKNRRK
jgi:DNA repair photolyase